jgi:hypothetical protein
MCVRRRNICRWMVQTSYSARPSYCDNFLFFVSHYSSLNVPISYNYLLRTLLHLFSLLLAKVSALFLLLFFFVFPLLAGFLVLLFPLHFSLLSLTHFYIHFPCIHVRPFRLLSTLSFKNFLALTRKQSPVKMRKFPQHETHS